MEFNFEAKFVHDLFLVSNERAIEIAHILTGAATDIERNINDYIFEVTEDGSGHTAMHRGKILKRLLQDIVNPQEVGVVIAALDVIQVKIVKNVEQRKMVYQMLEDL